MSVRLSWLVLLDSADIEAVWATPLALSEALLKPLTYLVLSVTARLCGPWPAA